MTAWTKEEFNNWKAHPLTKQFFGHLEARRAELMERWADGSPMEPADQFAAATFGDIMDLNYEDDVEPFYELDEESTDEGLPE
jgi:hypothetical protein